VPSSAATGVSVAETLTVMRAPCCSSPLEHDPEKWNPVFRKDHAQTKS
jgi:hypothetical protein